MRVLRTALLLSLMIAAPRAASANIWDWIHEMSGPGPYDAYGQTAKNFMVSLCPGPIEEHPVVGIFSRTLTADSGIKPQPCFFVDKRWVRYDPVKGGNFPTQVDLNATDFGISWQFASYQRAEFGVGAGWATFNGLDGVSRRKFTLTLPRVVVMPLAFLPKAATNRYVRIFKFHVEGLLFPEQLDAGDFGVEFGSGPQQSTFSVPHDYLPSFGFIFDLGELIGAFRK